MIKFFQIFSFLAERTIGITSLPSSEVWVNKNPRVQEKNSDNQVFKESPNHLPTVLPNLAPERTDPVVQPSTVPRADPGERTDLPVSGEDDDPTTKGFSEKETTTELNGVEQEAEKKKSEQQGSKPQGPEQQGPEPQGPEPQGPEQQGPEQPQVLAVSSKRSQSSGTIHDRPEGDGE